MRVQTEKVSAKNDKIQKVKDCAIFEFWCLKKLFDFI